MKYCFNILLVALIAGVVWIGASEYRKRMTYAKISETIRRDLEGLKHKRPLDFPKADWEFLLGWTINGFANCMNSYEAVPIEDYTNFLAELEQRIEQQRLGYDFYDWFWDRLEQTSKYGARYSSRYRPTSPERLREAAEGCFMFDVN